MNSFYTDVIRNHPRFNSTSRINDLNFLEPVTRQKVQAILADAHEHGVNLMVFETYRSQARQELLFNQGATQLRKVGVHHFGLACDIVKNVNGEPSWKGSFSILRDLSLKHGLIWGGDWGRPNIPHSFIDAVHVQRCSIRSQSALFSLQFYPDEMYNPYNDL